MNEHWTNDPDLVENYVLGTISQEGRKALEAHLGVCASCMETVARERLMKQGVRSYGRRLLKERLKTMVDQRERRAVPWPHVVSIAAALLIIVGLGLTYRWWGEEEVTVREEDIAAEIPSQGESDTAVEPGKEGAEKLAEESKPAAATRSRARRETEIAVSPSALREVEDQKEESPGGGSEDFRWISGVIVVSPARHREDADAALMMQGGEPRAAAEHNLRKREKSAVSNEQEVRILQRPEHELPPGQRFQLKRALIPTMFRQTGDRMELTLFSDTLGLEGQTVRVRRISSDSLLVFIDGSTVAYKIPVVPMPSR
ncbi:MAG: hypothetical protein HRF44_09060 [Ignavibacterium sp.]|jgi:hypothetical protein